MHYLFKNFWMDDSIYTRWKVFTIFGNIFSLVNIDMKTNEVGKTRLLFIKRKVEKRVIQRKRSKIV